jgi:hypothetical protein
VSKIGDNDKERPSRQGCVDCASDVHSGELEWSIKGFSWLKDASQQARCDEFLSSPTLNLCGHCLYLQYDPEEVLDLHSQKGSLCIRHREPRDIEGVTFRYTLWIKSKDRGWIQWGNAGSVCTTDDAHDMIFGPDVCDESAVLGGIFGLDYDQLQTSEWVVDDMLRVKLKVELRGDVDIKESEDTIGITVPQSTLGDDFAQILECGAGADVKFDVQGEEIRAHSPILSARSEVLKRQLSCGMQESLSKQIKVEDCDPPVFKAMLLYLYSDSFSHIESFLAQQTSDNEESGSKSSTNRQTKMSKLQQILATSHKYQLSRLQLWCERELRACISVEHVCDVLCQAHLYEAKKLEEKCLEYIKVHMQEVVKTDSFGALNQAWPKVSLKIILHQANVSEKVAETAMEKQDNARKRKRDE